ncbi:putative mannose-sensitive agglutinin [Rhizobium favelukesii]|uniref:Mannose-sensitive agglutinin n=1 Tax=Rhizobium favelukesii TaxID=348824 RepID=W6R9R4_9HYPH|nr:hypothetical protein [Rhizobium favelukesii]CDM57664.1 putative mannose-sensitive agglutinin [Rhizobium favelukesii]
MAIAFRSISSTTYASRANTAVTAPAGIVNGDILIAIIFLGQSGGTAPTAPTAPSGFTQIGTGTSVTESGNSFSALFGVYWKRAASESGSYTFTHSTASSQAAIAVYSGALSSGSPVDVLSQNSGTLSPGTTATATGVTTTAANDLVIYAGHNWDATGTLSPPTGMTERVDSLVYIADVAQPSAGASGNKTQTLASNNPWAAFLVAIKEAAGGSSTPQSVTTSSTTSATCSKRAGKVSSATSASSVTLRKVASKIIAATVADTVVIRKAAGRIIAVASSSAVSSSKRAGKAFSATSSAIASIVAHAAVTFTKTVGVSCTAAASVTKSIAKRISATLSIGALVDAIARILAPSPIDLRRKSATAAAEGRTVSTPPETRSALTILEHRTVPAPEEHRAVSVQEPSRAITPSATRRRDNV